MECYKIENATAIGGQTLVGSYGEFPRERGNCFDLKVGEEYIRIINFKVENLKELIKRGLTWPIKIKRLSPRTGLVIDERIPDRWYQDRYCETCSPKEFLNHFQLMRHERAVARGDRTEHPNGIVSFNIGQNNPIFDYVGEKKVDFSKWKVEIGAVKQFGEDGREIKKL